MFKSGKVIFQSGQPMRFDEEHPTSTPDAAQAAISQQLGATMKAYLARIQELLKEQYAPVKNLAPVHFREPCNLLIVFCNNGIVLRYEKKSEEKKSIYTGWANESLEEMVPKVSEGVVFCHPTRDFAPSVPEKGIEFRFAKVSPGKPPEDVLAFKMSFESVLELPESLPTPPAKPYCVLSVNNAFELQLHGVLAKEGESFEGGQEFITRTEIRINLGWECLEVFPSFAPEMWKPEYAPLWAERDLLASIVAKQLHESQLQALDPRASARRYFSNKLTEYKALLDSIPEREEVLHQFLMANAFRLCPAYIQMKSKLPLGAHVTDFVFQEATGDYLLVEIERSEYRLFRKDGDTSGELNHARNQIIDWRRYIEDNLNTVQRELGLGGISPSAKALIIIGRSATLNEANRRKLVSIGNESPNTRIITYDDVFQSAKAMLENLFGLIDAQPGSTEIYYLPKSRGQSPSQ